MKPTARICSILHLFSTIQTIFNNLSAQRSYLNKNIQPALSEAMQQNDGSLDDADLKKITHYYGLAVPAIVGEAFCILHNKKMSSGERTAATSQGAMTGLFDDFFDKQYLSDASIEKILQNENAFAKKSNEKLFMFFYRKALQSVPDKQKMQQRLMDVYKAQLESKKQVQPFITEKEIREITFYKGGASLLFYRSAFLPVPSAAEEKLAYDLGSLMQLSNDIFDVYKDRENGIKTLVTETTKINSIRILLQQQLKQYYSDAYNIGLPGKNVNRFLSILTLGIFSRAFVCLDQLESNEKLTGNQFDVKQYSRKQLICDMDGWGNKMQSAKYHLKLLAISC